MIDMDYPNNRDCEHGQLKRSCNICEYEYEIVQLKQLILDMHAQVSGYLHGAEWKHWQEFHQARFTVDQ